MSIRGALVSALHAFVVLAFLMGGIFCLGLSHWPILRVSFFEESGLVGLGLLGAAFILGLGFYLADRGRYLVVRMGVGVDLTVLRQSIEHCFARNFPKEVILSDVELGKELQVRVSLQGKPSEEVLAQVEKQLMALFREKFGYPKPFQLIVKI